MAEFGGLPGVGGGGGGEEGGGVGQGGGPGADRLVGGERVDGDGEAVEEFGQAAGQVDVAAAHVVDGEHPADQAVPFVGHGHTEEEPVEAGPPRVGVEGVELVGGPVGGVEAPADAGLRHPLLGPGQVVVVEVEPAPDRLPAGQVEHLGGGHPGRSQGQELGHDPEDRIGLAQRPVGQPDPEIDPGRAGDGGRVDGISATGAVEPFGGAERGVDQRGERLDVGAHHDDVAGLEGRVGGQEVEDGVAHHLHLPAPPVTGVDGQAGVAPVKDGPVVAPRQRQAGRGPVGPHVGLDPLQERRFPRLDGMVVVDRRAVAGAAVVGVDGREDQLHLPGVTPPGGQERVGREVGRRVGGTGDDRPPPARPLLDPAPQHGRGMEQEEVHVAMGGQGPQHGQRTGRQPGEAEQ